MKCSLQCREESLPFLTSLTRLLAYSFIISASFYAAARLSV